MRHFFTKGGTDLSICACNGVGIKYVDGKVNATKKVSKVTCGNCRRTKAFKVKNTIHRIATSPNNSLDLGDPMGSVLPDFLHKPTSQGEA